MRLIRILQLGCVTGVAAAPALADQNAEDLAKAREVLRASPAEAPSATPSAPTSAQMTASLQLANPANWQDEVRSSRMERELALQAEAKALRAIRAKKLAERNAAWELAVTQRAVAVRELAIARQKQFETMAPENALQSKLVAMAKPMEVAAVRLPATEKLAAEEPARVAAPAIVAVETPAIAEVKTIAPTEAEVEARAQEIVKAKQVAAVRPADVAVVEAKAAPAELRISAAPAAEDTLALQEKALSALRAEIAPAPAPVLVASAATSTPVSEPKRVRAAEPAPAAVLEKSTDEIALEQRAREILNAKAMQVEKPAVQVAKVEPVQVASAARAARDHDNAVSNIREQLAASSARPVLVAQAAGNDAAKSSLEIRAQEIAREQQQKNAAPKAPATAPAMAPAKATVTAAAPAAPATGLSDEQQRKAFEALRGASTAPAAKTAPAPVAGHSPAESAQPSAAAMQDLRNALATDSQRKLEERAREILRERQGQAATPAPAPAVKTPAADVAVDAKAGKEKMDRAAREKAADEARAEKALAEAKAKAEKEKAAKAPKPAAVVVTSAAPAAPAAVVVAPAVSTLDVSSDAKARAELDKAIRSAAPAPAPDAPAIVSKPTPPPAPAPAPAPRPIPAPVAATAPAVAQPIPVVVDPAMDELARKDLEARTQALLLQQRVNGSGAGAFTSVPLTKQQKIAQLTADYKADKMTPAEYHKRRAEILSQP